MKKIYELNIGNFTRDGLLSVIDELVMENIQKEDYIQKLEFDLITAENSMAEITKINKARAYWKKKYNDTIRQSSRDQQTIKELKEELEKYKNVPTITTNPVQVMKVEMEETPRTFRKKDDISVPRFILEADQTKYKKKRKKIKPLKEGKNTYKHEIESAKGNVLRSKHSGHKTKHELLIGIFPDGTVHAFDSVNEAKRLVRKTFEKYKTSNLTNISRAARRTSFYADNNGTAYGIQWSYIEKPEGYKKGDKIELE